MAISHQPQLMTTCEVRQSDWQIESFAFSLSLSVFPTELLKSASPTLHSQVDILLPFSDVLRSATHPLLTHLLFFLSPSLASGNVSGLDY